MNRRKRRRNHKQPEWYSAYGGRRRLVDSLEEKNCSSGHNEKAQNVNQLSAECSQQNFAVRKACRSIQHGFEPKKNCQNNQSLVVNTVDEQEEEISIETQSKIHAVEENDTGNENIDVYCNVKSQYTGAKWCRQFTINNDNSKSKELLDCATNGFVQNANPNTNNAIVHKNDENLSLEPVENEKVPSPILVIDDGELELDIQSIRRKISLTTSLPNFVSILSTTGSMKLTAANYEFMRSLMKSTNEDFSMLTYRTVHDVLWPHLKHFCLPKSILVNLIDNSSIVEENTSYNRNKVARIVLPSTWAILDVSTYHYYKELISTPDFKSGPSIDNSKLYVQRDLMTSVGKVIPVLSKHGIYMACSTDDILIPVGTVKTSISIHQWERTLQRNYSFEMKWIGTKNTIEGTLGPIWMVEQNNSYSDETDRIISCQVVESVLPIERNIIQLISAHVSMELDTKKEHMYQKNIVDNDNSSVLISPGDICAFLRPLKNVNSENRIRLCCLLIARHKEFNSHSLERERIVWIAISRQKYIKLYGSCPVSGFPFLLSSNTKDKDFRRTRPLERHGKLNNGKLFIRYPIILYHDDFNPSSTLYPQGSVGGCYFLPLGLSQETRSSPTSARIITLTPSGCSTVLALKYIVDDLVDGATKGIQGKDPFGKDIQIFLDTIGFVADYPACAPVLDVKSHTADAPCHCCSFRRRKHEAGSNYSYSVMINSRRLGYVRTAERSAIIRRNGMSDIEAKHLGMKEGGEEILQRSPFFILHDRMKSCEKHAALTSSTTSIIPFSFDPYNAVIVAPDHALMGICRSAIDLYFHCLPNNSIRIHINILICQNLFENGLPRQQSVYNHSTRKLQSMTMTSVFCVLLVLSPICDIFLPHSEINEIIVNILTKLQEIVALVYWWPRIELDGDIIISENIDGEISRRLISMIDSFTKEIHSLCILDYDIGKIIDKPNIHRLVELGFQSIPNFGHARLFSEMPLETVHQVLKSALKGNTHPDKHITAVFHAICGDWQRRFLTSANQLLMTKDRNEKYSILKSILFLLLGNEGWDLDVRLPDHRDIFDDLMNNLHRIFKDPFKTNVLKMASVNNVISKRRNWNWRGNGNSNIESHIRIGKELLAYQLNGIHIHDILECSYAIFSASDESNNGGQSYPYHRIFSGTVIQAIVQNNLQRKKRFISRHTDSFSTAKNPSIFLVCGILRARNRNGVWCIVMKLTSHSKYNNVFLLASNDEDDIGVIELNETVRRAACIHKCNSDCKLNLVLKTIEHSGSLFEKDSEFVVLKRNDGYPPRMA